MINRLFFITTLSCILLFPVLSRALEFETDIQPILKKKCYKCHSGPKAKKGLQWDSSKVVAEWIKEGKDSVIIPGNPAKSEMYIKVEQGTKNHPDGMPPLRRGDGPVSEGQLKLIGKWIAEGAKMAGDAGGDKKMGEIQNWTNLTGQTIKAVFVSLSDKGVVLKLKGGKEITYPLSKLTAESQQQAKKLAGGK
ncbi:MAG: hypothetical protein GXP30_06400 [Verrucomicrobia bacterium]|nr:hypothetical protein [Verrucomicrobiota bacterium]